MRWLMLLAVWCLVLGVAAQRDTLNRRTHTHTSADDTTTGPQVPAAQMRATLERQAANLRAQAEQLRERAEQLKNESQNDSLPPAERHRLDNVADDLRRTARDQEQEADELDTRAADLRVGGTVPSRWGVPQVTLRSDSLFRQRSNRRVEVNFFGLDLGINGYVQDYNLWLPERHRPLTLDYRQSVHVGLEFFPTSINIVRRRFQLLTSLYLDLHNYRLQNDVLLQQQGDRLGWTDSPEPFRANKLGINYLRIPVLFRFALNPKRPYKSARLAVGPYVANLIGSRQKTKLDGNRENNKSDSVYGLSDWQFGLHARIGIKFLEFYGTYCVSPLFRPGAGPSFNTFQVGLRVVTI